ncbi:MAG: synthase subunit delta [Planctomycetota bacterium]|jgi:F-type H+-transporting ATPase subunit delta
MATTQHIDEIASVYATSLLEVCDKQGGVALAESCAAELSALAEMVRADKRFAEFLKTPIIGAAARRASIDRIVKGKVSDLVYRFVMVVAAHGRAGRLADISDAFDGLLQARLGRVEVDMYTVTGQAAPDVVATVKGGVKEAFGKEAVIHQYADPNMIGGVKLRIGDQLIDGSVETQLRNMRDAVAARGTGAMRSRLGDFLA